MRQGTKRWLDKVRGDTDLSTRRLLKDLMLTGDLLQAYDEEVEDLQGQVIHLSICKQDLVAHEQALREQVGRLSALLDEVTEQRDYWMDLYLKESEAHDATHGDLRAVREDYTAAEEDNKRLKIQVTNLGTRNEVQYAMIRRAVAQLEDLSVDLWVGAMRAKRILKGEA